MSQFYKSEAYASEAEFYRQIMRISRQDRDAIAKRAYEGMEQYTVYGGSTRWEYEDNKSRYLLYSRSDAQLEDLIKHCELMSKAEILNEYDRCRKWITEAFRIKKEYPSQHNLMCARQWIGREWRNYKNARKLVKGF